MSKKIHEMQGAIVHSVRWVSPKSGKFKNYIKYIDRDEATRNYKFEEFSLYNDYMGNPKKSGSLFTNEKDFMNKREVRELKNKFELAQKNKSMMWQDVFSFRNEWLIENGYLDPKTNILDERKIRNAIRKSMEELNAEKGENELIWSASIHYNTKHIHVHVASVELKPNEKDLKLPVKKRGKRTLKSLKTMKSKFINEMRNRDEFYKELDVLARDNMIGSKKEYEFMKDNLLRKKMLDLLKYMPKNKRNWNYARAKEARPYLNAITKYYLENYCKDDYDKFKDMLKYDKEEQIRIYGIPKDKRKLDEEHYKETDLYKRMGNTILKELKDFINEEEYKNRRLEYLNNKKKFKKGKKYKRNNEKDKEYILKNITKSSEKKEPIKENITKEKTDFNKEQQRAKGEKEEIKDYKVKYEDVKKEKFYNYSEKNSELIRKQFPEATAVGSASFWKEKGFEIKEGAKGIEIVVPEKEKYFINKQGFNTNVNEATEEEKRLIEKGKLKVFEGEVSFNTGYVYDISQTVPVGSGKIKNEEIKETVKEQEKSEIAIRDKINKVFKKQNNYNMNLNALVNNIKKSLRNDLEHYLNMREFERMELQKEYDNGLSL
ncbi:MobP2 family relaxase [Clostridium baratii]